MRKFAFVRIAYQVYRAVSYNIRVRERTRDTPSAERDARFAGVFSRKTRSRRNCILNFLSVNAARITPPRAAKSCRYYYYYFHFRFSRPFTPYCACKTNTEYCIITTCSFESRAVANIYRREI